MLGLGAFGEAVWVKDGMDASAEALAAALPRTRTVAGDAKDRPFLHGPGAETFVELDRGLVPVEHRPLEASAIALGGDLRQMREQRAPRAAPAPLGTHEQVLEIQAALAEKGRVVVKEQREADGFL